MAFSPFQDIVLTLKDKLSIRAIEYFALVLEQQYSITKLLLLHEDELIQKVKETIDIQRYIQWPVIFAVIAVHLSVLIRWCRKKTPMITDACSECHSSPETPQTCSRMIALPLSICFFRLEKKKIYLHISVRLCFADVYQCLLKSHVCSGGVFMYYAMTVCVSRVSGMCCRNALR